MKNRVYCININEKQCFYIKGYILCSHMKVCETLCHKLRLGRWYMWTAGTHVVINRLIPDRQVWLQ